MREFKEDAQTFKGVDAEFVSPDSPPDICIDGMEGAIGVNGVLRLTLVRFRYDPNRAASVREVVATLSMSQETANLFAIGLVATLEQHGMASQRIQKTGGQDGSL
jgi:hypothetical protein